MGSRVTVTLVEGSSDYDDDEADGIEVHGAEMMAGDSATVCGMFFIDGLEEEETSKHITCDACIDVLNTREHFHKRKGKWY